MARAEIIEFDRLAESEQLTAVLERTAARPDEQFDIIDLMLRRFDITPPGAQKLFDVLEIMRVPLVADLERQLKPAGEAATPAAQARVNSLRDAVALASRLYVDVHRRRNEERPDELDDEQPVLPFFGFLPLVRAMDLQARIAWHDLKGRRTPDPAAWAQLVGFARRIALADLLDTPYPDPLPFTTPATARALFGLPLLFRVSRPEGRSAAQLTMIDRLARQHGPTTEFVVDKDPERCAGDDRLLIRLSPVYWIGVHTERLPVWFADNARRMVAEVEPGTLAI